MTYVGPSMKFGPLVDVRLVHKDGKQYLFAQGKECRINGDSNFIQGLGPVFQVGKHTLSKATVYTRGNKTYTAVVRLPELDPIRVDGSLVSSMDSKPHTRMRGDTIVNAYTAVVSGRRDIEYLDEDLEPIR